MFFPSQLRKTAKPYKGRAHCEAFHFLSFKIFTDVEYIIINWEIPPILRSMRALEVRKAPFRYKILGGGV
jgi:hypothetical protein